MPPAQSNLAPQWARSVAPSTQDPPQFTCVAGQDVAQEPEAHTSPAAQRLAQAPQFALSLAVFAQNVAPPSAPQVPSPAAQVLAQAELLQTWPPGQAAPHAPQLAGSRRVSTQASPHFVVPPPQTRTH